MSARKSSHRTIFLIVSSGSPLALIASSLRSTSKKPVCPMTRSLHPPMAHCGQRVRFVATWREEFFKVPIIRAIEEALVDRGVRHNAVDLDGVGALDLDRFELRILNDEVLALGHLVAAAFVRGGDRLAGLFIDELLAQAIAGGLVDLSEGDALGTRAGRMERNRTGDQSQFEIAFPVGTHNQLLWF